MIYDSFITCGPRYYDNVLVNASPPPTLGNGGALALMTCKRGKMTGKNPTKAQLLYIILKLPQFINYIYNYKRTKSKTAKPSLPGACSIDKSPLMLYLCPMHVSLGWGGGWGLHWLVHYHLDFEWLCIRRYDMIGDMSKVSFYLLKVNWTVKKNWIFIYTCTTNFIIF